MKTKRNSKRALVLSCLSLVLCLTMLIGSTFAWFTDNAVTTVNTIESGNLAVKLEMWDGENWVDAEGKPLNFLLSAMAPAGQKVLWEPGATYKLPKLRISNAGNLALVCNVLVTGIEGDAKLNEAIEWTYDYTSDMATGADTSVKTEVPVSKHGKGYPLIPADKADHVYNISYIYLTISGHMKEDAGNEYQGLTMDGASVTVQATQYTYESDSNNPMYDFGAEFSNDVFASTQEGLNSAISNADEPTTIVLTTGTYTLPNISSKTITITGSTGTIIDMSKAVTTTDCIIAFEGVTVVFPGAANYTGLQHAAKVVYKDCVINGQQTMYAPEVAFNNCTFVNNNNAYCVWTYGATNANFSNCTFETGGKAILVYTESETHATITVDNCTFKDSGIVGNKAAVEVGSSPYSTATTYDIYMNGCTVNGFDKNNEGLSTNSTFWGNKNSMDQDHLNVVIDGVDVY